MSYTKQMTRQYRQMILMGRQWRRAYQELLRCGWSREAARELANMTVMQKRD